MDTESSTSEERAEFVGELLENLWCRIARKGLRGRGVPWPVELARADRDGEIGAVAERLAGLSERAGRRVATARGRADGPVAEAVPEPEHLFAAMGVCSDGRVDLEAAAGPETSEERNDERFALRRRWAAIMVRFRENLDVYDERYRLQRLRPRYGEVLEMYRTLFAEVSSGLPVRELPVDDTEELSRIAGLLEFATRGSDPARVGDLPSDWDELHWMGVGGIEEAHFLADGIVRACIQWRRWRGGS